MKKVILPIIGAILLPTVFWRLNPEIEWPGIVVLAVVGMWISSGINEVLFIMCDISREKKEKKDTSKAERGRTQSGRYQIVE